MKKRTVKTPVKGGLVMREAHSGRFIQVSTKSGVSKSTNKTETTIKEVASRRDDAMRRLVNR